jgi:hypothetical protein
VAKEDDIANTFMELRKRMYELSPQQGAWFYCKITVEPSGKFETDFNYDDKPNFSYNPTLKKWEDDIKIMEYAPTAHNGTVYAPQFRWGRRR